MIAKNTNTVVAFFTIVPESFKILRQVKEEKNKPYTQIPAFKIARLAVDKNFQGCGLGAFLMDYALGFIIQKLIKNGGGRYITVDAFPHRIKWYKENFGFTENTMIKQDGLSFTNLILDTKLYSEKLKS